MEQVKRNGNEEEAKGHSLVENKEESVKDCKHTHGSKYVFLSSLPSITVPHVDIQVILSSVKWHLDCAIKHTHIHTPINSSHVYCSLKAHTQVCPGSSHPKRVRIDDNSSTNKTFSLC